MCIRDVHMHPKCPDGLRPFLLLVTDLHAPSCGHVCLTWVPWATLNTGYKTIQLLPL